jgi:cysteinyl-tRNA synthetase
MIKRYLGETIDIHGGGEDLVFPHHENEIAQSEALHQKKFANYWIHNGMIMVDGKKMSKSEGNFITIEKALQSFSGNAIRFFVLSAHYRQPVNYTEQALEAAQVGINKLLKSVEAFNTDKYPLAPLTGGVKTKRDSPEKQIFDQAAIDEFHKAMSDDLNTPCALAILFDLAKRINKAEENTGILGNTLAKLLDVLGFNLQEKPLSSQAAVDNKALYDFLLQQRREARELKNFAKADQIRILIEQSGYKLKDSPQGTELIPV